jgi:Tfp pilus assembly protein PilN
MIRANQLTLREWILLFLLLLAGTGMGFYYWLLSPLWEQKAATEKQLMLAEQELRVRQEWQKQDEITKATLLSLAEEQAALQAQLDGLSHEQDLIDYIVELGQRTRCEVRSLEIEAEQVSLNVTAPSYQHIRSFLADMEQSPNLVPLTAIVTENRENFGLQLRARITLGQLPPSPGQSYQRTVPFGR